MWSISAATAIGCARIHTPGKRSNPRPMNNRSLRPDRPGERRPKRTEVHHLNQSVQFSTATKEQFSAAVDRLYANTAFCQFRGAGWDGIGDYGGLFVPF